MFLKQNLGKNLIFIESSFKICLDSAKHSGNVGNSRVFYYALTSGQQYVMERRKSIQLSCEHTRKTHKSVKEKYITLK